MTEIHQGKFRTYTFNYVKADGSAGKVEKINEVSLTPAELGTISRQILSDDGSNVQVDVAWAGSGDASLVVNADADLGAGDFPIISTEAITFVAPLGADNAVVAISDEQDVVAAPAA